MRTSWWRIGWRNLGRNRRRSVIAATTLAVGYWSVVVVVGWMLGLVAEMIGNGTGTLTGQLQVHADDFRPDESVHATIGGRDGADLSAVLAAVEADPEVEAAAPRVYGGGLVSTGSATAAGVFLGVETDREARVSRILSALDRGRLPETGRNELLIGAEMARTLDAGPGDEVVVVAPAIDGSLGNDLYVVSGVFETGLADLDRTFVIMPMDVLQFLMALDPNRIHEIAATVPDPWAAERAAARIDSTLVAAGPPVLVESWATLRPEMVEYAQLSEAFQWVMVAIVFGMAIFGIANTMLMATYERRREFAVLLALGARPWGILASVLAEAVALAGVGLVAGVATAIPVLVWWHNAPPDLSWLFGEFTMMGALMRPVLRVEYPWDVVVDAAVAMVVTAVLASVYPAIRAARLPPADTMAGR
jgi:ABC-type lipoprotein release transport system permease subunit